MKKYLTKPVIAVLAVATIAGGLTPVWASNSTVTSTSTTSSTQSSTDNKVVMSDGEQEYTRYRLKDLVENDPATLNLLLKTQADYLYIVVDEIDLDAKMSTFIEDHADEWEKIYKEHYADIYLEVRFDEQAGIVNLKQETKNDKLYITGKVTDDVDKVVLNTPNSGKIEVLNFEDHTFTVTIPSLISSTPQYVTVQAYDGDKLLDTEKLLVNTGTVEDQDVIVHSTATYNSNEKEVKVLGIVKSSADEVYVTYDGEKKKATLKKVWDGTEAFSADFDDENPTSKEVLIEAYDNGEKVDSEKVDVTNLDVPVVGTPVNFTIKGTATISPKNKVVTVKGTIESTTSVDTDKYKLYALAPDGVKYELQLKDGKSFEANLPFKNRSFSSKGVTIQVYEGSKLVMQTLIAHGVPINVIPVTQTNVVQPAKVKLDVKSLKQKDWKHKVEIEVEDDDDDDDHDHDHGNGNGNGKGHGHEKNHK